MNYNELLKEVSFETFADIISVSPRKVREALMSHYGIKSQGRSIFKSVKDKKQDRIKLLHKSLQEAAHAKEQEFIQELLRNWLYNQRPLLKSTLDFLQVENDNGLVEVETNFFEQLSKEKVKELVAHLSPNFAKEHIYVYLSFMKVPNLTVLL